MIKKYWAEILVFSAIAAVMLIDLSPNITWMNTDSDGAHYIYAAKYMYPAHNTSAPLFLLIGRLFLFLPFGTEAWRMGLILALSTIAASIVIYQIVKYHLQGNPQSRYYGLIASLIYGGSALVISQSTIIDTYAFNTLLALLAYYSAIRKRWIASSVFIGLLWAIHTLFAWMTWIPLMLQFKPMRDRVLVVIPLLFLLFYLYLPLVTWLNNPPFMWGNTDWRTFFAGQWGVWVMLTGGLAMWDIPKRILDTIGILGVSLGFAFFLAFGALLKFKKTNPALCLLTIIPTIYFLMNLSAETYVYMLPTIAFGAVAVGVYLSYLKIRWSYLTAICAVVLLGFNANYFDIGRTLDPEMSAMKFYNEELSKVPDGEIFLGGGWNWAMVFLYNKNEGRNIIPVSTDMLPSKEYRRYLDKIDVKYEVPEGDSYITAQGRLTLSVASLNDGVWIAKETKPEVFQYVIEKADDNQAYLGRWIGQELVPEWKWKPSNPYEFISGQLEVSDWHHILWSNKNANVVVASGLLGWAFYRVFMARLDRRKKNAVVTETA